MAFHPRHLVLLAALFACFCLLPPRHALSSEDAALHLTVTASDPASRGALDRGEPLYLRIEYHSASGLRLQARGYHHDQEVTAGAAYNPAPVYPAGEHEALVWLAYNEPTKLDQVRILVHDAEWRLLTSVSVPVSLSWTGNQAKAPRARPVWALSLSEQQQEMTRAAISDSAGDSGGDYLMLPLMAAIPGYLVLQLALGVGCRGGWRVAALLPLVGMIPLFLYTALAFIAGSNLWPLLMIFLTPLAFLYLCALALVRLLAGRLSAA